VVSDQTSAGRRVLLNRLYAKYAADPAFAVVRAEGKTLVPGDGPMSPKLFFVGEAPGRQEQRAGKPFVGASGELLNEMLESVGITREEVFITNIVKYRPKDNRDPDQAERQRGSLYLRREHAILRCPPMVMLGRHAKLGVEFLSKRKVLLPNAQMAIGEWSWLQFGREPGFAILPLHHPAYAIYQKRNRPLLFEQFKAVLDPPSYTVF
jgi:DNA polymerase